MSEPPAEGDETVDERNGALDRLLGDPLVWDEPPAGLEDQVVAAIAAEAAGQQGSSPVTAPAPGRPAATSRRPWARPFAAGVGAAAAIVLVVVIAVGLFAGGDDDRGGAEVALAGTELAPDASADALVAETPLGTVVHLDVQDLPPAPEGAFYEVWLRQEGDDGDAVSAGTFHMRGGDGEIELWSGVSPEQYPLLTVTLQQEGEGPQSSGEVVLRGQVG